MNKDDKRTLTPRLRFPEFRDDWQMMVISPYLEECSARVDATTDFPIYTSARSGLTRQDAYYGGREVLNDGEYGVVPPDCFVYRHMSDDGRFVFHINKTGGNIAVSKEYPVFRPVNIVPHFLLAKLNHGRDFKAFAIAQKAGGTRTRLYLSKLQKWATLLPSLAEQQKIAECLTSLDELIGGQGRKVEALKVHKQGLMRRLFPRAGETLPRLRFREFFDAPEWEGTRLQQLVDFQSGSTPYKANPAFWNGSIPWVSAKDMKQLFLDETEDHISNAAVDDGSRLVSAGTLLMLTRGMTLLKDVPICVLRREMSFNQDVKALRPKDGVDSLFLAFLLLGNKPRLLRMVDIAGHGTGKLNTDKLKVFGLVTPQPAEQRRIADCLSALDAVMLTEAGKLAALKTHKRGLMRQLFPSPEGD